MVAEVLALMMRVCLDRTIGWVQMVNVGVGWGKVNLDPVVSPDTRGRGGALSYLYTWPRLHDIEKMLVRMQQKESQLREILMCNSRVFKL